MMIQYLSILLVVVWSSGVLCSGTQQGISSTQAGQTLQIQPNVRKYNKHTATEKPCTTGTTTGTRKDKPENYSDDYVPIGGGGVTGPGYPYSSYAPYPYPYPYPYQPGAVLVQPGGGGGNYPYRPQYPYEPQYPAMDAPPLGPYYAPSYYAPAPYPPLPYPPAAYPAPQLQQLYDQSSTVVDAYRGSPLPTEQPQFYRQPVAGPVPYGSYVPQQPLSPPYFRAHAYGRPQVASVTPAFLQQRDAAAGATVTAATNSAEPSQQQYEPQQPAATAGSFDNNQYHY